MHKIPANTSESSLHATPKPEYLQPVPSKMATAFPRIWQSAHALCLDVLAVWVGICLATTIVTILFVCAVATILITICTLSENPAQFALLPQYISVGLVVVFVTLSLLGIAAVVAAIFIYTFTEERPKLHSSAFRSPSDADVYSRYKHIPSESLLLRLPPEIRGEISQYLLGSYDAVYIQYYTKLLIMSPCQQRCPGDSYHFPLRLSSPPGFQFQRTRWGMYAETDHLLYTTRLFCFTNQQALAVFTETLTVVQRRNVKRVHLFMRGTGFIPLGLASIEGCRQNIIEHPEIA